MYVCMHACMRGYTCICLCECMSFFCIIYLDIYSFYITANLKNCSLSLLFRNVFGFYVVR